MYQKSRTQETLPSFLVKWASHFDEYPHIQYHALTATEPKEFPLGSQFTSSMGLKLYVHKRFSFKIYIKVILTVSRRVSLLGTKIPQTVVQVLKWEFPHVSGDGRIRIGTILLLQEKDTNVYLLRILSHILQFSSCRKRFKVYGQQSNTGNTFNPLAAEFSGHTRQKPKTPERSRKICTLPIGQTNSDQWEPCKSGLKTTWPQHQRDD